jgi:hypothetical protein
MHLGCHDGPECPLAQRQKGKQLGITRIDVLLDGIARFESKESIHAHKENKSASGGLAGLSRRIMHV